MQTATYQTNAGIYMFSHSPDRASMMLPIDDWLRRQLSMIQDFVISHVAMPADVPQTEEGAYVFKDVLERDSLLIPVSKWCRIYKFDAASKAYIRLDKFLPFFGKGSFSATIEASHIYIGPHKGGQHFSLSLRVMQIVYNEENAEDTDVDLLNELLAATVEEEKKAKRLKKPRKTAECRKSTKPAAALDVKLRN